MSRKICGLLVVLGVFAAHAAFARCGSLPGDSAAVADIRARAEMQCDCSTAYSHGVYVRCVRAVATTAVQRGELTPSCRSSVVKCANKSTCGRAGAVVCRRTTAHGVSRCAIKKTAARCHGSVSASACIVTGVASCCDADSCTATTTTSPPTTTTIGGTTSTTSGSSTSTTIGGSTTTTTLPGTGEDQLVFTTVPGTTNCGGAGLNPPPSPPLSGELDSDTACTTKVVDLGMGCLYFGGGHATVVPPGRIPDGTTTSLSITGPSTLGPSGGTSMRDCSRAAGPARHCVNDNTEPACTSDAQCGGVTGACALDANCFFGPPLPIPSPPPVDGLTTCVVNVVQSDAGGTFDEPTGATAVSLPLSTRVYITGNEAAPCPQCLSGTCDASWITNTGDASPDAGASCTPTGAGLTSTDCRPSLNGFQAPLGITLAPLTTGTASLTSTNGVFCPGQNSGHPGAFGQAATRCIRETGMPGGDLSDDQPHAAALASTFCIPATHNTAVDGVADLPGAGAIAFTGNAQIHAAPANTTTTSPTTSTTGTTAPPTTTTTIALVCTDPTVGLPPFGSLTIQIKPGTTNCGGAALTPGPAAPFDGQLLDGSNASIVSLGSGCLYVGGGANTALPAPRIPDGADVTFGVVGLNGLNVLLGPDAGTGQKDCSQGAGPGRHCIGGGPNQGAACATDVDCGGHPGSCALDANCIFGSPLPLPVTSVPQLSSCIVNVIQQDMCGEVELLSGGATLNAALSSRVYLTGNVTSSCPRCVGGTCDSGPNSGQTCAAVGALGTSLDCPPDPDTFIAPLNVVLSPLTTGTLSKTAANGLFCPGQTHPGAFGRTNARTVQTTGAGLLSGTSLQLTAAGPFCTPRTGNTAIDGLADIPGPGAVGVPSQTDVSGILNLLGLPLPPLPPLP